MRKSILWITTSLLILGCNQPNKSQVVQHQPSDSTPKASNSAIQGKIIEPPIPKDTIASFFYDPILHNNELHYSLNIEALIAANFEDCIFAKTPVPNDYYEGQIDTNIVLNIRGSQFEYRWMPQKTLLNDAVVFENMINIHPLIRIGTTMEEFQEHFNNELKGEKVGTSIIISDEWDLQGYTIFFRGDSIYKVAYSSFPI